MLETFYPAIEDLDDATYSDRLGAVGDLYEPAMDPDFMDSTSLDVLKGYLLALQEKHITLATPIMATPFVIATNNLAIARIDNEGTFQHVDGVLITDKKSVSEKRKALVDANKSLWAKVDENYYIMKQYEAMIDLTRKAIREKQNFFQRVWSSLFC